ncbi:hypothetical protein DRQ17_00955 [bacterium]|uniref:Uncharacterized protein n=1 Tax=candidate division WOR-3 bacterium TaxID=2052148 RepID=A0A7C0Z9W7_UNCW3|nr:MAG: hypothetical protein DRQ17_00955 [bacterium]RKZ23204.1 MAG: hypothetical protein DRQ23_03540 [bacterium]HDI83130.1 hypothetical protein [candidate division WOR-3 bacterium]
MNKELLKLKIKALNSLGEAILAAKDVLEAVKGVEDQEKIQCYREHIDKLEELYEECLECCLEACMEPKEE